MWWQRAYSPNPPVKKGQIRLASRREGLTLTNLTSREGLTTPQAVGEALREPVEVLQVVLQVDTETVTVQGLITREVFHCSETLCSTWPSVTFDSSLPREGSPGEFLAPKGLDKTVEEAAMLLCRSGPGWRARQLDGTLIWIPDGSPQWISQHYLCRRQMSSVHTPALWCLGDTVRMVLKGPASPVRPKFGTVLTLRGYNAFGMWGYPLEGGDPWLVAEHDDQSWARDASRPLANNSDLIGSRWYADGGRVQFCVHADGIFIDDRGQHQLQPYPHSAGWARTTSWHNSTSTPAAIPKREGKRGQIWVRVNSGQSLSFPNNLPAWCKSRVVAHDYNSHLHAWWVESPDAKFMWLYDFETCWVDAGSTVIEDTSMEIQIGSRLTRLNVSPDQAITVTVKERNFKSYGWVAVSDNGTRFVIDNSTLKHWALIPVSTKHNTKKKEIPMVSHSSLHDVANQEPRAAESPKVGVKARAKNYGKNILIEGSYLGATMVLTSEAKILILAALSETLTKRQVFVARQILNSKFGEAGIKGSLGFLLLFAPFFKDDPKVQKLAKYFGASAIASVEHEIYQRCRAVLVPLVTRIISTLPDPEEDDGEDPQLEAVRSGVFDAETVRERAAG